MEPYLVMVNDKMQQELPYWRTEPVGEKFPSGFSP